MISKDIQWNWLFPHEKEFGDTAIAGDFVFSYFAGADEGTAFDVFRFFEKDFGDLVRLGAITQAMALLEKKGILSAEIIKKRPLYRINRKTWNKTKEMYKNDNCATSSSVIKRAKAKYPLSNIDFDTEKIKNDKKLLIQYLEKIIGIKSSIYSLQKRYDELYFQRKGHLFPSIQEIDEVDSILSGKVANLQTQLEQIEGKIRNTPSMKHDITLPTPQKPTKPVFTLEKPIEPSYEKPGLFNKKRVLAENEALKLSYEKELSTFHEQQELFERQLDEYSDKMKLYEAELAQCKADEERLNKEAYENELKIYETNKESWLMQKGQLEKQIDDTNANCQEEKEKLLCEKVSVSFIKKAEYEMLYISSLIEKLIEVENQLWNYGVIYEKYRNHVIIATLCDYLKAGRCDELEGPNGAYNLYEQELRADIIINKLDTVITSLEEIKKNQYLIYSEIQKVNESLSAIEGQLFVNNLLNTIQISQLNEIAFNTGLTAYNTAVTAYYSQKNAQLTEAVLFTNMLSKM